MKKISADTIKKGKRTLLTSLLFSAPGPVVTGISVVLSYSTTQTADFLRRTIELAAIFTSWWVYRKIHSTKDISPVKKEHLEKSANLFVGCALMCSGAVMFVIALTRLKGYTPGGDVTMGLIIAALGLVANTVFWFRYRALNREQASSVLAAQHKLYRAKAFVDLCVVAALSAVAIAPLHPATLYVDIIGSFIISIYLLWNGLIIVRREIKHL